MNRSGIDKALFDVRAVPLPEAREFIQREHYARGASNTAVFVHGLFYKPLDFLCGVVWWLPPTKPAAQSVSLDWRSVLSLSRMAVAAWVPKNACSFLLARSIRLIRADGRFKTLLTYADEAEGHRGGAYRAANWTYLGPTAPGPRYRAADGRLVSVKAGPVTKSRAQMEAGGAVFSGKSKKHKFVYVIR